MRTIRHETGLARLRALLLLLLLSVGGVLCTTHEAGAACTYSLSPTNQSFAYLASNGTVSVTATTNCTWTVVNTNTWISINSATNNTNNGNVLYSVLLNPSSLARTGKVTIAGLFLTVNQTGAPCTFTLSATSQNYASGVSTGQVDVTTPLACTWAVLNTNTWITLRTATNNTNSGTVSYVVTNNPTGLMRTGLVTIAGQTVSLIQTGAPCTFVLGTNSQGAASGGSTGQVNVTTLTGCTWSAFSSNNWILINSTTNHTNSGTVSYTVAANPTSLARTSVLAIADQFLTVNQTGAPCTFSLSTNKQSYGASAGSGQVSLTTLVGCTWTVINTNGWVGITSATNGSDSTTVTYNIAANPSSLARTGVVTIAGQTLTLNQTGTVCTFTLSANSQSYGPGLSTGRVDVTTPLACTWTVSNTNAWISLASPTNNTNSGTVTYVVTNNPAFQQRTGLVTIAGQSLIVTQSGAACTFVLSASTQGAPPGLSTGQVTVTTAVGCTWSASSTSSWIVVNSTTNHTNSGTVSYTVAANPSSLARTSVLSIGDQFLTVNQTGAPCVFTLSATNQNYGFGVTAAQVSVTTPVGCAWSAVNTNNWITITSPTNNIGSGIVSYIVASNLVTVARTGVVSIAGQALTVSQAAAPCAYAIFPPNDTHGYGTVSDTVAVTTSSNCPWTVVNTNPWVTITPPPNGTGPGTVTYTLASNPSLSDRTGTVVIATQPFVITQKGLVCSYSISPTNRPHGYKGTNSTVSLTTSNVCAWTVSNTNSWITITSLTNGTGSATISYSVTTNQTALPRSGNVTIAGQIFTLTQSGAPCTFTISPSNKVHGFIVDTGLVTVTTLIGCDWGAWTTNAWITFTSSTNGVGPGNLGYGVELNPDATSRTGTVTIAGQKYTVTQQANLCTYKLSPTNRPAGHGATTGGINVRPSSNSCPWTAISSNAWIQITAGTSGSGTGLVSYAISANPSSLPRTGLVMVADQVFKVTQDGSPCTYSVSPATKNHGNGATSGMVTLGTPDACVWTVTNYNSWITITSPLNNTNGGPVTYTLQANPSGFARTGLIGVGDQILTINQAGANCSFGLSPPGQLHGNGVESGLINVSTIFGCSWAASTTNGWITFPSTTNGVGPGSVSYAVAANTNSGGRSGAIKIDGKSYTVDQLGTSCPFKLSSTNRPHGYGATGGSVNVTNASNTCAWVVFNTNTWITITSPPNGMGNGTITYTVDANPVPVGRTGVVMVAEQTLTITQDAHPCTFSILPGSRTHGHMATNGTVSVSASDSSCSWTVTNINSWITITSPTNGMGNGNVSYNVDANMSFDDRTGQVMIASRVFTLTQHGVSCSYSISPTNSNRGYSATTGTVTVTTSPGCAWDVVNTNSWITITSGSNGIGTDTVVYTLDANPDLAPRSGTLVIVDEVLTLNQAGAPCNFVLSPSMGVHDSGATTGMVTVTAQDGCTWAAATSNDWIAITSDTLGSGNGTVTYTVTANPNGALRSGVLVIDSMIFPVYQFGTNCGYVLSTTNRPHGFGATMGTVTLYTSSNCAWTVVNTNPWITVTSPTNGVGTGSVTYAVAGNPGFDDRSGVIVIGDQTLTVTQRGYVCTDSISPANRPHGWTPSGGTVSLVTSSNTCGWLVVNTNDWIVITSPTNGMGNATVSYTVGGNPSLDARVGVVMIAEQPFTLTQGGIPCNLKLSPTNRVHGFGATNGTFDVSVSTNLCSWTAVSGNSWITITSATNGAGNGTVSYSVSANFGSTTRTGAVMVGDRVLVLAQGGVTNGLSFIGNTIQPGGQLRLSLAGGPGGVWELQSSSDLKHWQKLANLTNTTGRMEFIDTISNTATQKFYRAVQQPALSGGASLTGTALQGQGQCKLTLIGGTPGVWELQASSDLRNWTKIANLTNDTGRVDFTDTAPTNTTKRFYRAVQK